MLYRAFRLPFCATEELREANTLVPYCSKRVRLSRFAFGIRRMVSAIAPTSLIEFIFRLSDRKGGADIPVCD
jgi:hypothetical protein